MSKRATVHDTFVIERELSFKRELVFAAWSSREAKARWFAGPSGWEERRRELEFRVGGREIVVGRKPNGNVSTFDAHYYDIVPYERIIYAYEMHIDDVRISVSVATVEFKDHKGGTQLTVTEQGVFLDDFDDARGREHGTRILMDQLERSLRSA
jgi:uncharacterized protein YndB with AHSA1/START domain